MSSDTDQSSSSEKQAPLPPDNGGVSLKRKRQDGDAVREDGLTKKQFQKMKRKMKKKAATSNAQNDIDEELGINKVYSQMDGQLLADYIAQKVQRFSPDSSAVELEDMRVPAKAILDTSDFEQPRTMDNLPDFLRRYSNEDPSKTAKEKGTPHTIVVAGAGLLCADIVRALRVFQTKNTLVCKLFAKHMKIKDSIQTLQKMRTPIAVGTPQRIYDLFEDGMFSAIVVMEFN